MGMRHPWGAHLEPSYMHNPAGKDQLQPILCLAEIRPGPTERQFPVTTNQVWSQKIYQCLVLIKPSSALLTERTGSFSASVQSLAVFKSADTGAICSGKASCAFYTLEYSWVAWAAFPTGLDQPITLDLFKSQTFKTCLSFNIVHGLAQKVCGLLYRIIVKDFPF